MEVKKIGRCEIVKKFTAIKRITKYQVEKLCKINSEHVSFCNFSWLIFVVHFQNEKRINIYLCNDDWSTVHFLDDSSILPSF